MKTYPLKNEPIASRLDSAEHRLFDKLCKKLNMRPAQVIRLALAKLAETESVK